MQICLLEAEKRTQDTIRIIGRGAPHGKGGTSLPTSAACLLYTSDMAVRRKKIKEVEEDAGLYKEFLLWANSPEKMCIRDSFGAVEMVAIHGEYNTLHLAGLPLMLEMYFHSLPFQA